VQLPAFEDKYYVTELDVFLIERPRSRCYEGTAALRLIVQPCDEDVSVLFSFFRAMEHRWKEIDRGKPKYSEKNLSQCHFVHHKSNMDRPGIKPEPPR
jgi:hypothetical protein